MKKRLISAVLVMILVLGTYSVAWAEESSSANATRNLLESVGNIVYTDGQNIVEIHANDLYLLADKMDSFKKCVADQLALCHTYFTAGDKGTATVTDGDIKIVHTEPSESDSVDPVTLDFGTLLEGIAASQSIPSDVTEYGYVEGTSFYKTKEGGLTTDGTITGVSRINISSATPENLSAGSAAWVNGELILGTGTENAAYYNEGYNTGHNAGYNTGYNAGYNTGYDSGISESCGTVFYLGYLGEYQTKSITLDKDYNEIYVMHYRQATGHMLWTGTLSTNCSYSLYYEKGCVSNYGRGCFTAYKLTNCKKGNYVNYTMSFEEENPYRPLNDILIIIGI